MELIDKDKVVAELKRRIDFCDKLAEVAAEKNLCNTMAASELLIAQFGNLLYFLDALETKDVNFEKELDEWMRYGPHTSYPWCTIPDAVKITAEHFYELGLKAKKGE